MVGCAMCRKMPTGRYLHGAHGTPYCDKTLNLLVLAAAVSLGNDKKTLLFEFIQSEAAPNQAVESGMYNH